MFAMRYFRLLLLALSPLLIPIQTATAAPEAAASLFGTVMCGYQGWFAAPDDGSNLGWVHYGFHANDPARCQIDLWPDMSGHSPEECFDSPLKFADGTTAQVFSSAQPKTVQRHFDWMRQYGIDGVFLQRFGTVLKDKRYRDFHDRVMQNVHDSAKATGRTWAVMYDLTGLKAGELESVIMQDWKRLRTELHILDDPTYQRHNGKPVVAVWGIGFSDNRLYTLDECQALLRFFHDNPEFGALTTIAGVPWHWRTLDHDATSDPKLHEVLKSADIINPWSVGRYGKPEDAQRQIASIHEADASFCRRQHQDYLPVIFPGFSWRNLMKSRGQEAKLNAIPRLGGQFLWSQAQARIRGGCTMLYIAMFDEMDEGTAIFKTASQTPAGTEGFVAEPELQPDHYLWLTGMIGRALRHEIPLKDTPPAR